MAALAYTLGKREINHYFSVRSAKVLALAAVLLLAGCHLASRRYRGEGPSPCRAGGGGGGAEAAPLADTRPRSAAARRLPARARPGGGAAPRAPGAPTERTPARAAPRFWSPAPRPPALGSGRLLGPGRGAAGGPAPAGPGETRPPRPGVARRRSDGGLGVQPGLRGGRGRLPGAPPPGAGSPCPRLGGPALEPFVPCGLCPQQRAELSLDGDRGRPVSLGPRGRQLAPMPAAKWRRRPSASATRTRPEGCGCAF